MQYWSRKIFLYLYKKDKINKVNFINPTYVVNFCRRRTSPSETKAILKFQISQPINEHNCFHEKIVSELKANMRKENATLHTKLY